MSFFPELPPPPEPEAPAPQAAWLAPPFDELGVATGLRRVIVHEDRIVFAILDLVAFSTGFQAQVVIRLRQGSRNLHMGHPSDPDALRFGVQFSDGRKATTGSVGLAVRASAGRLQEPEGPFLSSQGGGGGNGRWSQTYWIWPLPPPGRIIFAAVWRAGGMPELLLEADAAPILEAAGRSERIW